MHFRYKLFYANCLINAPFEEANVCISLQNVVKELLQMTKIDIPIIAQHFFSMLQANQQKSLVRYIHDEHIDGIMSKCTLLDVHTFYADRWEFLSQTI